jgi:predicted nucleotidyltransferase
MTRDELIASLVSLKPALKAEGVEHIALFGSRARGDNRPDSDLDVLVAVEPGTRFSLIDLVGVELIIADTTGLTTNAVVTRGLDAGFHDAIKNDLVGVF